MNILVCIKPDITGEEIGPLERMALEAGLVLKADYETRGEPVRLDVITAGPASWQDILYRALGTGADRGFHVMQASVEPDMPGLVPAALTARRLARAVRAAQTPYDLILTGIMSQDLMAGQTGPMLARYLALTCVTAAVRLAPGPGHTLSASREMEGGVQELLEIPLPALASVQSGVYVPRYPVLSHMLKAKAKPVITLPESDLVKDANPVPTTPELFSAPVLPEQTREGQVAEGGIREQISAFKLFLRERGLS